MNQLPGGWVLAPIGQLGAWQGGGTPSKRVPDFWTSGSIPWASPKDIKRMRLKETEDYITPAAVAASAMSLVDAGSVIVVTRSGILRRTVPIAINEMPMAMNQDLKALTPAAGISAEYIAWSLRAFEQRILDTCTKDGTTVNSIDTGQLQAFEIPLAPIAEQQRIVVAIEEEFSRIDAGISTLNRVRQNLKRMRAAILRDQTFYPDAPVVTVRSITSMIQYGYTAKATNGNVGPKMLRITDIQDGSVNWESVPNCEIQPKEIAKFRLKPNDFVFARTGATVGKSLLITDVPEAVFASYLIRIRFNPDVVPEYIALFFQTQEYWTQIRTGSVGIGQPNVNATTLANLTLHLPPTSQQRTAVDAVQAVDRRLNDVASALGEQMVRGSMLQSAILAAAFAGQLVPQEPTDEPASLLLDRIASERSQSNGHKSRRVRTQRTNRSKVRA